MRLRSHSPRHATSPAGRGGAPAFTLIELLVVVAIIAVLMALLMTVLGRVQSSARQAKCVSRLHQIQVACIAYAGENNGEFPSAAREYGFPHEFKDFDNTLGKYLKESRNTALFCPGELSQVRNPGTLLYNTHYTTYQYFNFPSPFLGTYSTAKPDLSRVITAPTMTALWGCLTCKSTDGTALAHREPAVKKAISGMNAVYADGHARWVPAAELEVFWSGGGLNFYWPKPPAWSP